MAKKTTSGRVKADKPAGKSNRKKFKIAQVGCGAMGHVQAKAWLECPEVEIVALCDTSQANLKRIIDEKFAPAGVQPRIYEDYDQLLAKEKLDAVALITPHVFHFDQIRKALEKGLDVLTDKPMVTDSEQARQLVELAARRKKLLSIAYQAPVSAEFPYIKNLIRRGELGTIQVIDTYVAQDWFMPLIGTWRQDPEIAGGGMLYDSGAHMMNAMMWLLENPIKRVFAMVDNCGSKVEINGTVSILFENGCHASVACVGNARLLMDSGITIYGTKGTIRTGIWGGFLEHNDEHYDLVKYPYVPYPPITPQRDFVDALLGRDKLRCPGKYGILLAELMDAIYESIETGQPVDVKHRDKPLKKL